MKKKQGYSIGAPKIDFKYWTKVESTFKVIQGTKI